MLRWHNLWNVQPMKHVQNYLFCLSVFLATLAGIFSSTPAYSQIDFYYGKNTHGLRIGGGMSLAWSEDHYHTNPLQLVKQATLDYEFSPFFSIGLEGQYGWIKGVDNFEPHHLYYTSSADKIKVVNLNVKASVGLFWNIHPLNAFQDALNRMYVGVGVGRLHQRITLTVDPSLEYTAYTAFADAHTFDWLTVYPFSFGTFIDLPNVLGYDRLEINPNYQLTYMNSLYADGFISNQYSHLKGFYNLISINVKYKF